MTTKQLTRSDLRSFLLQHRSKFLLRILLHRKLAYLDKCKYLQSKTLLHNHPAHRQLHFGSI